VKHLWKITC
jgi:hypothetical protein